ncbi:MAG: SHOCT domain-containing protein [Candidatus Altiarchaeota archaeon]|nr:SHOCT domain-containing protein [Candidatus Altiarchaeota archaeon]
MYEFLCATGVEVAKSGFKASHPFYGKDWLFGVIPFPLIWNLITTFLVVLIFWWLVRGSRKSGESSMEILKKRYAKGEIDRKTFLQMKKDLE